MTDTLLLAGLALGFIATLAWLEDRANRRAVRRRRTIERVYWPDSPPVQPRAFTAAQRAFYAKPPKSSDLLPWR